MLEVIRDIAIIILAVESIVIGALLVVVLFQLRSLMRLLQKEVTPMLGSANDTVSIVRGTADFVSDTFVNPLIKLASYFAAIKRAIEVTLGIKPIEK